MQHDLTVSEVISDPMINLILKADGIRHASFAQLLESAARVNHFKRTGSSKFAVRVDQLLP